MTARDEDRAELGDVDEDESREALEQGEDDDEGIRYGGGSEIFGGPGEAYGGGYTSGGFGGGFSERHGGAERDHAGEQGRVRAERGLSPYGGGDAPGFGTDYGRGYSGPPTDDESKP